MKCRQAKLRWMFRVSEDMLQIVAAFHGLPHHDFVGIFEVEREPDSDGCTSCAMPHSSFPGRKQTPSLLRDPAHLRDTFKMLRSEFFLPSLSEI
jgi:hypothetical protein